MKKICDPEIALKLDLMEILIGFVIRIDVLKVEFRIQIFLKFYGHVCINILFNFDFNVKASLCEYILAVDSREDKEKFCLAVYSISAIHGFLGISVIEMLHCSSMKDRWSKMTACFIQISLCVQMDFQSVYLFIETK